MSSLSFIYAIDWFSKCCHNLELMCLKIIRWKHYKYRQWETLRPLGCTHTHTHTPIRKKNDYHIVCNLCEAHSCNSNMGQGPYSVPNWFLKCIKCSQFVKQNHFTSRVTHCHTLYIYIFTWHIHHCPNYIYCSQMLEDTSYA